MDNYDKLIDYIDRINRLSDQLHAASQQQKLFVERMMFLNKNNRTESDEYKSLEARSKALQEKIDHFTPILNEELTFIRELKSKYNK